MAYSILLTSLYTAGKDEPVRYYYAHEGNRIFYCDAMLTVEASAKYVLAEHHIDEIMTIGKNITFDEGDDGRSIRLRDGKTFYTSDINDLSTYSLLRYRLAQYIDELKIEQQDLMDLLTPEEQDKVADFIRQFYKGAGDGDEYRKFNRFFGELAQDGELYARFMTKLKDNIPQAEKESGRYIPWIKNYLYSSLKDSQKLELLEGNEDVQICFIPTTVQGDGRLPINNIMELVSRITEHEESGVEVYIALHSDDPTDNYVLMNVLDVINAMPGLDVKVKSIFTTTSAHDQIAGEIRDDTESYGISEIVAATSAFLNYGKADLIVNYWEKTGTHNEEIERMIYAMRRIDAGISLCDTGEIERGVDELRNVFIKGKLLENRDYYSRIYSILAEGIKRDYGSLLEGEDTNFIDLVKWTYRKGFYQQTLTLIESKAPRDFVDKGFYYYCNDEEKVPEITEKLAEMRNSLRPFELYMMDDIEHYYIKFYGRRMADRSPIKDRQRAFADFRIRMIGTDREDLISAYTLCDDIDMLEDLLYAYYHIGDVRNKTNHAEEGEDDDRLIVDMKDTGARMTMITESIDYFLKCYDKASVDVQGKENDVVRIPPREVKACAKNIKSSDKPDDGDEAERSEDRKNNNKQQ